MKYILLNDISYIFKQRKKFLLMLISIPIIVMLIVINSSLNNNQMICYSMGTNLVLKESNLIEYVMFAFNICIYIFLAIDLYTRDVMYELDNIFFRMSPEKWISRKCTFLTIFTILLKILQYLFLSSTLFFIKNNGIFDIKLILYDITLTLLLQLLFILVYSYALGIKKYKYILYFICILIIIIIPKDVLNIHYIQLVITGLLIVILTFGIKGFIKKFHKKVFEK
ncbi:MAG: hypothetical protein NC181_03650 [Clostridium sp.]|nr:hypothetical protein [Clostridium sp.]MCM1444593.1 hypothetical protein [Candidatus Amulumruptor caecigallinarius]